MQFLAEAGFNNEKVPARLSLELLEWQNGQFAKFLVQRVLGVGSPHWTISATGSPVKPHNGRSSETQIEVRSQFPSGH